VKFLSQQAAERPDAAERFRREARAAAKIRSEHVARVLDVGTLETGLPYMVMEFLEGNDIAEELRRTERLPIIEAVEYILQAIEALWTAPVDSPEADELEILVTLVEAYEALHYPIEPPEPPAEV